MHYQVYSISELKAAKIPACLSADEMRMQERRGAEFGMIRALLRLELAKRLHCAPEEINISTGHHGKPSCVGIEFNISHSHDCLCMAFHHRPVGVDVEKIRTRPYERLARHFMADAQLEAFLSRQCPAEEFFACWCAAEALVKMSGDTIWNAKQYPFIYREGDIILSEGSDAQIRLFEPSPGYMGAIAFLP